MDERASFNRRGMNLSLPGGLLRLEGLTVFAAVIVLYANQGFSAWTFLALLLVPDVSMIGYLRSPRLGAILYDAAHFYAVPAVIILIGLISSTPFIIGVGLIWAAHIGMDRTIGYGLKYTTAFKDTHLQRV